MIRYSFALWCLSCPYLTLLICVAQQSKSTLPSISTITRLKTLGTTRAFSGTKLKTLVLKSENVENAGASSGLDSRARRVVVPTVEKGIQQMVVKKKSGKTCMATLMGTNVWGFKQYFVINCTFGCNFLGFVELLAVTLWFG